jgi:hypothetical protein
MARQASTFHDMIQGCRRGDRPSFARLVQSYLPLLDFWVDRYFPSLSPRHGVIITEILTNALIDSGGLLGSFQGTWEREFLHEWRLCALRLCCREASSVDEGAAALMTRGTLTELFQGLPLLHRELVWLHMCGAPTDELTQIMSMRAEPVHAVLGKAMEHCKQLNLISKMESRIPLIPPMLLVEIGTERGENCVSVKAWSNIIDGQIVWTEKEGAESHAAGCLHCLSSITGLREMVFKQYKLPVPDPSRTEALLLSLMGAPAQEKSLKGTFGRFFKKATTHSGH